MTDLLLVTYLILWGLVLVLCFLLVGVLRQLGSMDRGAKQIPLAGGNFPDLENDGPPIGSSISMETYETCNDFGTVTPASWRGTGGLLLVFLSPMCEPCQHVVEPLNALITDRDHGVQGLAIIRTDEEGCRAFLSVFPLRMPAVCDAERTITVGYDVHRTPFGLFYDQRGILIRKGFVETREDLRALLGNVSAPGNAWASHVPPIG